MKKKIILSCHELNMDKIAIEDQLWDHIQANNKVIYGLGIMSARVWNLKKQNVVVDPTLCKVDKVLDVLDFVEHVAKYGIH